MLRAMQKAICTIHFGWSILFAPSMGIASSLLLVLLLLPPVINGPSCQLLRNHVQGFLIFRARQARASFETLAVVSAYRHDWNKA